MLPLAWIHLSYQVICLQKGEINEFECTKIYTVSVGASEMRRADNKGPSIKYVTLEG